MRVSRLDAITRARTAEEVPLATAVGLLARQRLTGEAPPPAARPGLELVAPWIEEKAGAELDALGLTIDDQAAFATLSRRLLEDLELAAEEPSNEEPDEGGDEVRAKRKDRTTRTMPKPKAPMAAATWRCARTNPREEGDDESADSEADDGEGDATSCRGRSQTRRVPTRFAATGPRSRSTDYQALHQPL